jgi:hypothetical protein
VTAGAEAAEFPAAFVAVTLTLYCAPFTTEPMVQVVAGGVAVQVRVICPLAVAVAVYPVMAAPLLAGAVQLTGNVTSCAETTVTPLGASGTAAGVPLTPGDDGVDVPTAFVAVTVTEYVTPFTSEPMVQLVVLPLAVQVRVVSPEAVAVAT